jgi:hypothetical protein
MSLFSKFDFRLKRQVVYCLATAAALTASMAGGLPSAYAVGLSSDAKAAIPHDVQQLIVVDYRAMQASPAAMSLRDRVMPPELKRLEAALVNSGLNVDQDADALAFAAFRAPNPDGKGAPVDRIVGIAQGQFHTAAILASFAQNKTTPTKVRNNSVYAIGSGLNVVFLNQTTMVFGDKSSIRAAVDARDGFAPNFLTDSDLVAQMATVDSHAVWSLLDAKGTQVMMKNVLGEASQIADYDTVKNLMRGSSYTMDFANGVKFNMAVNMSDTVTAATCATLMKGVQVLRKAQGSPLEKAALDQTKIDSTAGTFTMAYASSDSDFTSLLTSPLFQSAVK